MVRGMAERLSHTYKLLLRILFYALLASILIGSFISLEAAIRGAISLSVFIMILTLLCGILFKCTDYYLSILDHTQEENHNKKERRRLRLKEQLEGLYSPLRAEEKKILHIKVYGYQLIADQLKLIFDNYIHEIEFLASDNLKKEIYRLYYENLELSQDRWNEYIDNLIKIIKDDTKYLLEKYNKLTG